MTFEPHYACPSHCCPIQHHGCKYGYDDCPVVTGKVPAEHLSEFGCADGMNCEDRGYEQAVLKALRELLERVEHPLKSAGYRLGIQVQNQCRMCMTKWSLGEPHPENGCLILSPMMKHAKEYLAGKRYGRFGDSGEE